MTHTLIYPHTTVHNAAGHLEIGGCDVVDLAHEYGTPLFIYDEQTEGGHASDEGETAPAESF